MLGPKEEAALAKLSQAVDEFIDSGVDVNFLVAIMLRNAVACSQHGMLRKDQWMYMAEVFWDSDAERNGHSDLIATASKKNPVES